MLVGLAFSGGGTRAAAFSFGVLQGMADTTFDDRGRAARLIDRIDFIRAVSGGSVSAAYFGLKRSAAFADFRERFLTRNAEELVRWRCSLAAAEVTRLRGTGGRWDCDDVKVFVARLAFDQLGPVRAARLNAIPTRFQLPTEAVDDLISAGQEALQTNPTFRSFRQSLGQPRNYLSAIGSRRAALDAAGKQ